MTATATPEHEVRSPVATRTRLEVLMTNDEMDSSVSSLSFDHRSPLQAWTAADGAYTVRVRLPGVTSAAAVRVDVVGGDTLEVAAEYGAFEGAVEVVGWKLSHRLPFTLPSDDGSGGAGAGPRLSQLNLRTFEALCETTQMV